MTIRSLTQQQILTFRRVTIYKQAEVQKRAFIATVNRYNAAAKETGSMQMDTNADYTWNDVLSAQESFSRERENATTRGIKGLMYKQFRRLGDNSESFQSWLKLLPTGSHYLSVLCGGLTLMLDVSHLRHLRKFGVQILTYPRLHNKCPRFGKTFGTLLRISRRGYRRQRISSTFSKNLRSCISVALTFMLLY